MDNTIQISKEQLAFIENVIYQKLKELKDPSSSLYSKLKLLEKQYNEFAVLDKIVNYHANRFKFLKEQAQGQYKALNRNKIIWENKKQIEKINKMYELAIEITNDLMQRDKLEYAVYFTSKGKVYRTKQNEIDLELINLSKSNQSMRLSASAFKKAVLEKKQAMDITEHYNSFIEILQNTYKGKTKLPNKIINAGNIAEAFERHLQNMHKTFISGEEEQLNSHPWDLNEVWRYIKQSKGTDPWYTGGDVGNVQVKNIGKGNVRLSQLNTIEDIVNFLIYLGKNNLSDTILRQQAREAFNVLYNEVNNDINNFVTQEGYKEIIEDFKKLEKS